MDTKRFSYEGIACAVAGVLGIVGVLSAWWQVGGVTFDGTNVSSGMWAFSFAVAYVVMSDRAVRKIASILMAVSATLMTGAAIAGIAQADDLAVGGEPGMGLWLTLVAGVIGMIGGYLGVRAAQGAPDVVADEDVIATG
jgi:hypothetical protein